MECSDEVIKSIIGKTISSINWGGFPHCMEITFTDEQVVSIEATIDHFECIIELNVEK